MLPPLLMRHAIELTLISITPPPFHAD